MNKDEMIEEMQKDLVLSEQDCVCLYEKEGYRKIGDDEIVIKQSKINALENRNDRLKMELKIYERELEKAKQGTREILQEILYTKSCEEWFENEQLVDFGKKIVDKIENLAKKHGIELED